MCSMQLIPSHLEELVEVDLVGTVESSHLTHSAMRRLLQEEVSLLNFGLDFLHGTITSFNSWRLLSITIILDYSLSYLA